MACRRLRSSLALALVCGVVVAACGGSSTSPTPTPTPTPTPAPTPTPTPTPTPPAAPTTTFQGVLAGDDVSGLVELVVKGEIGVVQTLVYKPRAVWDATGTVQLLNGGTANLTGTFDDVTGHLSMSGDGFTLEATLSPDSSQLSGTFTGPVGFGIFTALNIEGESVTAYCGTAGLGSLDSGLATWNLVIQEDGRAHGVYFGDGGGTISGQLTGNSFSANYFYDGGGGTASGTLSGETLSGTWTNTMDGSAGRWTNTAGCS